jgi:hypothetical protein
VDMSSNIGNSSHLDVHDASPGFCVWTEEMLGRGANWFFIFPNVHGLKPDGTPFHGLAVKLFHGVAMSWDGRKIRHCTSLSHPDGEGCGMVGEGKSRFENHLYGTFTAAKEKIVRVGRAQSAASYEAASDEKPVASGKRWNKKKRRKPRKKRRRLVVLETEGHVVEGTHQCGLVTVFPSMREPKKQQGVVTILDAGNGDSGPAGAACAAPDLRCPVNSKRKQKGDRDRDRDRDRDGDGDHNRNHNGKGDGGNGDGDGKGHPSSGDHSSCVSVRDLDVGGRYQIPRKKAKK